MDGSDSSFAALQPSTETLHHLAAIIESSGDAIISVGLTGAIVTWNPAAERIYGYAADEVIGDSVGMILSSERAAQLSTTMTSLEGDGALPEQPPSEEPTAVRSLMRRVAKGERIPPYEAVQRRKDGREIAVSISIAPLFDLTRALIGAVVVVRDVSERKELEASLQRARERLEAVVSHAPIILIALDMEGRITLLEGKGLEAAGRQPGALIGFSFFELWQERPDVVALFRRALTGKVAQGVGEFRGIIVDVRCVPLRDQQGVQTGVIAVAIDISDRAKAEALREELLINEQQARTEAEAANRLMDEFLSIAAHELKTPVTGMKLYVEMLARGLAEGNPRLTEQAAPVLTGYFGRLERLINDLLDLSRLSLGRMDLRGQRVALDELVRAVAARIQAVTPSHELHVEVEPVRIELDPDRIEQVLLNLIGNAVKFSPESGRIAVRLSTETGSATISVQDWGAGIPRERQARIFERFYQAHTGARDDHGGMGVGLYLSREIVRRHGGAMWFESEEGRGSTFAFSLPNAGPAADGSSR